MDSDSEISIRRNDLVKMLGQAMQDVWEDHCGDTNCVPDCIKLEGRNARASGSFAGSLFAFTVARRLEWLATQPPNDKVSDGSGH